MREETCAGRVGDSDRSSMRLDAAGEFFHGLESRDVLEMVSWCKNSEKWQPALIASSMAWMFAGRTLMGAEEGSIQKSVSSGLLPLLSRESVSLEMPIQDDLL